MATNKLCNNPSQGDAAPADLLNEAEIICMIGGPGVGKGTQGLKLANNFNATHLSVGDLFRDNAQILLAGEDGFDVKSAMSEARLAPIAITQKLLGNCLGQHMRAGRTRFLVDGFPRTVEQAVLFTNSGYKVKAVLYFKSSKEIAFARMMNRATTSGRVDDNAETFEKRYKIFVNEIEQIASYYGEQNKLHEVDCGGDLQKIYEQLVVQVKVIGSSKGKSTTAK